MPRFPVPEILRTPLESLFLQVKAMNEDTDVKAFLGWVIALHCAFRADPRNSKAIDPPKLDAIDAAWKTLQDLGAVEGEDHKSRLTALGRHVRSALIFSLAFITDSEVDEYDTCRFTTIENACSRDNLQVSRSQ